MSVNPIAVALAPTDTEQCRLMLDQLAPRIGRAEIRLDLMDSFSIPEIVRSSPVPLILTCRPPREGGRFAGSESERLDVLRRAYESGCAYIDIEADSIGNMARWGASPTGVIVSRHWLDRVPTDMHEQYLALREMADVVKFVGQAHIAIDAAPVIELLRDATTPVIAFAMGETGRFTRLMCLCFEACLLTYGGPHDGVGTAPGQPTVQELGDVYHLDAVGTHTTLHLYVCATRASAVEVTAMQLRSAPGAELHIAVPVDPEHASETASALAAAVPSARVTTA